MHPIVKLAKRAVESYVHDGKVVVADDLTEEMQGRAGVFVSLKVGGQLRGCIGTFEPVRATVAEEVVANAISSATRDPRFYQVAPAELPLLEYSVDVLTQPEPAGDLSLLDPKIHGIIVECLGRRGLLLPDLDGVDTVEDQIAICRGKAGIHPWEEVQLFKFEVKRFT
ncbi:MAG: AmmeMemoRadiSam system protein A [Chloroflexi bacterium]|nr:AmmeMemoRadiSam system protein A [Chloroflexota bacterium]